MRVSLVVPCFNEEPVLDRFQRRVVEDTAGLDIDLEIVYVDDGSGDGTLRALRDLAARDRRVCYVSLSRNFGKESAMLAGLRAASGDAIIILDADLQHPPELVSRMLALHRQGFDQVIARRGRGGERPARALATRLYYRLVNRWVDVELVDGVGDFRLLSRRAVDAVLAMDERNRFSKGLFAWIGFDSVTFDYQNAVRDAGDSKWTFRMLLNYGFDGLVSFNDRPLRAAIYGGLGLTAVAVGYMLYVVAAAVFGSVSVPGYVTIITAIIAMGGLQMFVLGIVGEYIGRIYYETKRRPHYLLKESGGALRHATSPMGDGRRVADQLGRTR